MNSKYYIQHHLWLSPNISNMSLCISAPLMVAGPSSSSRSFWMGRRLKLAIIIINSVRPCAWIKVINLHHHFTIRYWKSHSLGFGRDWVNLVQQRHGRNRLLKNYSLQEMHLSRNAEGLLPYQASNFLVNKSYQVSQTTGYSRWELTFFFWNRVSQKRDHWITLYGHSIKTLC